MHKEQLHNRFSQIVPDNVRNMNILIAGAGMTGSWTALALARMVGHVDIYDFDTIEAENVGVQAYTPIDIGMHKATTVAGLGMGLPIHGFDAPVQDALGAGHDIVVLCVDSIEAREEIARGACGAHIPHLIDTRVIGEIACIHPVARGDYEDFIESLPRSEELTHAPCGAKGTAYAGMWVASQVCAIVKEIGLGLPLRKKTVWHVGANQEITT